MQIYMCVHEYEGQSSMLGLPQLLSTLYFLGQVSHKTWSLPFWLDWMSSKAQIFLSLPLLHWAYRYMPPDLAVLHMF